MDSVSRSVAIGAAHDASSSFFKGAIDEVAVWRRALGAAEVAEILRRGKDGQALAATGAVNPAGSP
jgi:hypothetical protein